MFRAGFTLVELLVVIAIIGILIALLLPAVQSAREAARQVKCRNNLKNITLGLHLYHDQYKNLPPAHHYKPDGAHEMFGWHVFLLPYIEQSALHDALNPSERTLRELLLARTDIPLLQQNLDIFRCPTDVSPDLVPRNLSGCVARHFDGQGAPSDFEPATANYIGNRGFNDVHGPNVKREGVLYNDSGHPLTDVDDGTTHTFMLGERDDRCQAASWIGTRNPRGSGMWGAWWVVGRVSLKLNDPRECGHDRCTEGFSSPHPGGGYFALCDGSVRFVSENIGYSNGGLTDGQIRNENQIGNYDRRRLGIFQRLGIRDDGMEVPEY